MRTAASVGYFIEYIMMHGTISIKSFVSLLTLLFTYYIILLLKYYVGADICMSDLS